MKRIKTFAPAKAAKTLFQPFRAVGYVTSAIPFSLQARGNACFITTALEHNFQVFDVSSASFKQFSVNR